MFCGYHLKLSDRLSTQNLCINFDKFINFSPQYSLAYSINLPMSAEMKDLWFVEMHGVAKKCFRPNREQSTSPTVKIRKVHNFKYITMPRRISTSQRILVHQNIHTSFIKRKLTIDRKSKTNTPTTELISISKSKYWHNHLVELEPFPFGISRHICFFSEVGLSDQCPQPPSR
jgi:hypothetical protein